VGLTGGDIIQRQSIQTSPLKNHEGKNMQLRTHIHLGIWLQGLQNSTPWTGLSACGQF